MAPRVRPRPVRGGLCLVPVSIQVTKVGSSGSLGSGWLCGGVATEVEEAATEDCGRDMAVAATVAAAAGGVGTGGDGVATTADPGGTAAAGARRARRSAIDN